MPFRWGIFGTGAISTKFVAGLTHARDAEASFIASRSSAQAKRFADGMRIGRAIEGYAAAAAQGNVDAIYIATPPSEHAKHALLCIDAGIPVLIEKPFAATAAEAILIVDAARSKGVFAMEAMWTRFLPAAQALREFVSQDCVGQVRFVTGSFGLSQRPSAAGGLSERALGGGALAHLGVYPLSLGQWLFGSPKVIQATGTIGASGVDEDAAVHLQYSSGVIGSFFVSIRAWAPDDFKVLGSAGMTSFVGSIVRPHGLEMFRETPIAADATDFGWRARMRQNALVHKIAQRMNRSSRKRGTNLNFHYVGNGYHYEADEVRNCVRDGATESRIMPLSDSINVAVTIDAIRRAIHTQVTTANSSK